MMTTLNIVAWLVIGGLVGLLIAGLTRRPEEGGHWFVDLFFGLVGSLVAGYLLYTIGGMIGGDIAGVSLSGAAIAIVGAIILVGVVEWLRSSQS
jgi:uncharacterized membrane protein YeaQ/YmgE (transglycosylase-associated protein family)